MERSYVDKIKLINVEISVVQTTKGVKHVGYKSIFVRKRNENNEIIRYKARLVAQGFSQIPGISYEETYSPIMNAITFCFLIILQSLKEWICV